MGSRVLLIAAMVAVAVAAAGADIAADRAECADKLVALATCLTFVQGQGQAPMPDCCGGLKTVPQTSPKCLCVLVKDRDDPRLDLKLNVTRALGLPAACSAPSNISDCPRLLNLPPNSKEAQVFEQFAKQQAAQSSPSGPSSAPSTGAQKNAATRMRWLGVGGVGAAARAAALAFFAVPFLLLLR